MADKEQAWFAALQDSDENAFEALYLRHFSGLVGFVRTYIPNAGEEARDIVSDVFSHLWIHRKEITLETSLTAYLYAAVRNKTVDHIRKNKLRPVILKDNFDDLPVSDGYTPERELTYKEIDNYIASLIERLPPHAKVIFKMNRDEGLTYEEIAAILKISVNTVKTQMFRSLKFLKEQFSIFSR
jgi:RNA polymerase sigma-70 factor (ECF subfamily)